MKKNVTNGRKVALVTGAGRGIGKSIALALAGSSIDCILCARKRVTLESVAQEIQSMGVNAHVSVLDATNAHEVNGLFRTVVQSIGRLDILVNNVGGTETFSDFFGLSDQNWQDAFSLNFLTMVYFCREAIPWLKKSPCPRIINISTVAARQPGFYNPHYSIAKAAMLNLSKHLSNILAKDNILVNAICPSTLLGGVWERNVQQKAERLHIAFADAEEMMKQEESKKVPLEHAGTPEDVARLVSFLASEQANFITGTCIDVDGGTVRSTV